MNDREIEQFVAALLVVCQHIAAGLRGELEEARR